MQPVDISKGIPYALPSIGEEEIAEVVDTLRSGWITTGPKTQQFEEDIKQYVGVDHAVALNSCTAALHLALLGLGVCRGEEVITTPYTFTATANVIAHVGAKPVFVDVDERTMNIDPDLIVEKITAKTAAILPVHFASVPCDMVPIWELAEDHDLHVIEDAAHAIGNRYLDSPDPEKTMIGSMSDATCYSFYPTKNMTTGEGGALVTPHQELADRAMKLRLHGMSKDAWLRYSDRGSWYYEVDEAGWKYNMSDIQAAIGIHQLRKLDAFNERRKEQGRLYNLALENLKGVITPDDCNGHHLYHLYPLILEEYDRDQFLSAMKKRGVICNVHLTPLHLHPFYRDRFGYRKGEFPVAEWLSEHEVSLPLYPRLSDHAIYYMVDQIYELVEAYND